MNSSLQSIIDEALKKKMPNSTIQNVLKKYSDPSSGDKIVKYIIEMKVLGKIYMVGVLMTENVAGTKQILTSVIKKFGGSYTSALPMFDERGVIDVSVPEKLQNLDESKLEEACTDDAIECGVEEVEITDLENKIVSVRVQSWKELL